VSVCQFLRRGVGRIEPVVALLDELPRGFGDGLEQRRVSWLRAGRQGNGNVSKVEVGV